MNTAIVFLLLFLSSCIAQSEPIEKVITKLAKEVQDSQVKREKPYAPPQWHETKGIYPSNIKVNLYGNPISKLLRNSLNIFDNNMFVTVWTLEVLLTAHNLNPSIVPLSESQILDGLKLITRFRDRNINKGGVQGVPIYNFWSQIENENGTFSAFPDNLNNFVGTGEGLLERLGSLFKSIWLPGIGDKINQVAEFLKALTMVFHIPPDLDDSGCTLALGAALLESKTFETSKKYWVLQNGKMSELVDRIVKYAYRPGSDDWNDSSIDPRTYFFMHQYIYKKKNEGKGKLNLKLLTTWVMNLEESRKSAPKGVAMPEYINNVDISVSCNLMAGLLRNLVNGNDSSWFDNAELHQILVDTSDYILWAVESGRLVARPDIGMLYYPSLYNFYWFASRVYFTLELPEARALAAKFPVLNRLNEIWKKTVRKQVTAHILADGTNEGTWTYWQDFIGLADTNIFGQPDPTPDDRMFSTAVTVNALIDAWAEKRSDSGCPIAWSKDTPSQVVLVTQKAVNWLRYAVASKKFSYQNAFFSGSIKSFSSVPEYFPCNKFGFLNGSYFDVKQPGTQFFFVNGVIEEKVYLKMLTEKQDNGTVPLPNFEGFNSSPFPYWSSEPLTVASALAALSKYNAVSKC